MQIEKGIEENLAKGMRNFEILALNLRKVSPHPFVISSKSASDAKT